MKFVPPDTCLKDYKKRRSAFLTELIASTPNVSARAKEFRRWIDENSPYSDITKPKTWVDDTRLHGASARGIPRGYGAAAPNKCLAQSSKSRTQGEATNNRN
jgi:hypothetical protein